jgi:fluoroacetyl-CoA thioesterase
MALQPGLKAEYTFTVDDSVATDVAGSLGNRVLATPRMIATMERASMKAVWGELPEGATCVGYEVCVKHLASAAFGATCVASAELTEIVGGRKLRFDVRVECDGRTIGVGTHERRVIDAGKFDGANAVAEPATTAE